MKKFFIIFPGTIIIIIMIISCSKSSTKTIKSGQLKNDEISLNNDNSFQRLISLSYKWVSKLKDSQIDTATLKRLIIQKQYDSLAILSGISVDSANAWAAEANTLLEKLADQYGISQHDTGNQQCSCTTLDKITKFNLILTKFRLNNDSTNIDNVTEIIRNLDGTVPPKDGCYYVPYTACLVACTASGPWLYWLCSYGCYCGFCYGPTHDKLCHFGSSGNGTGGNTK